ncbi:acyl-CoA dehydrogenase family protein [Aeromicrobium sp. Leaf350]|uniref:acyl-CoA dehydrogenase family protein n=1 Tax=Aeromicrobium sp. Leaf350 TaxID=2876565 RepID=UPI001E4843E3|nr:acyl-CoA dehydrogenase family protein [Aeromicrobium sp. Leaf350]
MSRDDATSRSEEAELVRAVDEMVAAVYPEDAAQRFADDPVPVRAAWARLGGELDLIGLHLPTELGGQGQSFAVHAAVAAALGRRLTPAPHLPVLGSALTLLAHGGTPAQRERWLPEVVAGRLVVAVAGLDHAWDTAYASPLVVDLTGDACVVDGTTDPVVQGGDADLLLLVVQGQVLAVDPTAPGVHATPLETLDLTRPRVTFRLESVPAEPLGAVTPELLERTLLEATALLAAESAAAARTCLERTVEYATVRTQFDRPIGSFQAVQHALADLFGEVSAAEAAVGVAVDALASDDASAAAVADAVRVAKVAASEAFCRASRDAIHLHGGIGFTWEHTAHLFYRRALTDRPLLGAPTLHRRALARALVVSA